jgi:hypothetical protein
VEFHDSAPETLRPLRALAWRALARNWLKVTAFVATASGCEALKGNALSCEDSTKTVRQAIEYGDFKSAREWRDYTWKVCSDKDAVKQLDTALLESEKKALAAAAEASPEARATAQTRINAAQALWIAFDSSAATLHTAERLDATRKSADQLSEGLTPGYAVKVKEYNQKQHQKRQSTLTQTAPSAAQK